MIQRTMINVDFGTRQLVSALLSSDNIALGSCHTVEFQPVRDLFAVRPIVQGLHWQHEVGR